MVIVGEPQTGKTCICKQVVSDGTNFLRNYLMTHALDVSVKSINIPDTNDVIEMYLLDCSGRYVLEKTFNYLLIYFNAIKDDYHNLIPYFIIRDVYRDMLKGPPWQQSDMIVAVYDVTREDTFQKVAKVAEGNFH